MDIRSGEVRIAASAAFEMDAAFDWYEKRQPGLGTEFLRSCEAAFSAIGRAPRLHRVIRNGIRRALLRRFPFGVFFAEEKDTVVILAVVHVRRSPENWP